MTGRGPDKTARNVYRLESKRLLLEVPSFGSAPTLFAPTGGELDIVKPEAEVFSENERSIRLVERRTGRTALLISS